MIYSVYVGRFGSSICHDIPNYSEAKAYAQIADWTEIHFTPRCVLVGVFFHVGNEVYKYSIHVTKAADLLGSKCLTIK